MQKYTLEVARPRNTSQYFDASNFNFHNSNSKLHAYLSATLCVETDYRCQPQVCQRHKYENSLWFKKKKTMC